MLYLDFEGSHAKGVRQIGYLITEDNKITKAEEKNDDDAVKCLFNLQKNEFRYIAAHNSFVAYPSLSMRYCARATGGRRATYARKRGRTDIGWCKE